jgi:predicted RNase H-like nuclease
MTRNALSLPITVGIDVGGSSKGFHAVALQGNKVLEAKCFRGSEREHVIGELVRWCVNQKAQAVAVDAPCGWSMDGGSRPCERALQRMGISSFYTPMRAKAEGRAFYDWVRNGEALFHAFQSHFPLYKGGGAVEPGRRFCFETFPHAITWQRRGGNADAKSKRKQRRDLLEQGQRPVDLAKHKSSIDFIDAALCAQMAADVLAGAPFHALGDVESGFLLVPELEVQGAGR